VAAEDDFSNFDDLSDDEDGPQPLRHTTPASRDTGFRGEELPFVGYSYNRLLQYPGNSGGPSNPHILERTSSASSLGGKVGACFFFVFSFFLSFFFFS
jgi:hypothetical protein